MHRVVGQVASTAKDCWVFADSVYAGVNSKLVPEVRFWAINFPIKKYDYYSPFTTQEDQIDSVLSTCSIRMNGYSSLQQVSR